MKPIDTLLRLVSDPLTRTGVSRKAFLTIAGRSLAVSVAGGLAAACQSQSQPVATVYNGLPSARPQSPPATVPGDAQQPIVLEPIEAKTEQETPPVPAPMAPGQRVGYAVVGLGHLTLNQILPALSKAKKSKLVALVSGNPDKLKRVADEYGITPQNCYSYETYDSLRDNKAVDVIYIVLPNGMHAEYTIRGAQAGKHILCEKPMANSAKECQAMIDACAKAGKKLMIAYRIQYEPNNRLVRDMVQDERYGKVKSIIANNGQNSDNPDHWRFKKVLAGGGSLPDVGLYCLNTIRYLLGEEPTEVIGYIHSTPNDPRFVEVEEQVNWLMTFPSGVQTSCATGYGHHQDRQYKVLADTGWIKMEPAFAYTGLQLETSQADGKQMLNTRHNIAAVDQFAAEMDHMSACVLDNKTPFTPGEEGLQDQIIMEAIYQSAREGKPVKLPAVSKKDAFRGDAPQMS